MVLDLLATAAPLEEDLVLALALKQKQTKAASFFTSRAAAIVAANSATAAGFAYCFKVQVYFARIAISMTCSMLAMTSLVTFLFPIPFNY